MRNLMLFIGLLTVMSLRGQLPFLGGTNGAIEPVQLDYGFFPDLGGAEITNYALNLSFAKPLEKGALGFRLGYQFLDFDFNASTNLVDLSTYDELHALTASLFYARPLKNNWGIFISAGTTLATNFGQGLSQEDFVVNALLAFTKKWGSPMKGSNLLIGALYGTQFGEPTVFPAISYSQRWNEHWGYAIGVPVTGLNYYPSQRHSISILASPFGVFGNNSNEITVDGNRSITNTKLQFNGINTRLSYRYLVASKLAIVGELGIMANPTLKILNNDNGEIFDVNPESGAHFNIGLRYVLKKEKQNNEK